MSEVWIENCKTRTGKPILGAFIIHSPYGNYLQCEGKFIALKSEGKIYLDKKYWNGNYVINYNRNRFLNELGWQTQIKIKRGKYKMTNLN